MSKEFDCNNCELSEDCPIKDLLAALGAMKAMTEAETAEEKVAITIDMLKIQYPALGGYLERHDLHLSADQLTFNDYKEVYGAAGDILKLIGMAYETEQSPEVPFELLLFLISCVNSDGIETGKQIAKLEQMMEAE